MDKQTVYFELITKDGTIYEYSCASRNDAYEIHAFKFPDHKISHISKITISVDDAFVE